MYIIQMLWTVVESDEFEEAGAVVPTGEREQPRQAGSSTESSRRSEASPPHPDAAPSFAALLKGELARVPRRSGTVFCALVLPVLYGVVTGVLFGTNLVAPVGGFGFVDASLLSFPAVLIAAFGLLLTPVELAARRARGELRGFAARPARFLAAHLVARLVPSLAGIVAMLAIGVLVFGVRPAAGPQTALVTVAAAALGGAAFLAIGQLSALVLPSVRLTRVLGHVLLYPLVLVSGAVLPVSMLPPGVRSLAPISPVTQLVDLLRETWLAGAWSAIWPPAAVLVALFALAGGLAARRGLGH